MDLTQIAISGLKKSYPFLESKPRLVLDIESLSINRGEFFCLLGPSGCGKSTLLNILSGFLKSDSGQILIDDKNITQPNPSHIQVFQEYGLFPWKTVLQNVLFGLNIRDNNSEKSNSTAHHFIELVGLTGFENHYPGELSGGMKQRTALARALAVDPEILFMDEPFGALDSLTRLKMQKELERIWRETRKTILFVTHNIDESLALADRIAVMTTSGRIEKIINVTSLRPRDLTLDEGLLSVKRELYATLGVE
jgi:NitT/TauT family transport system ATP-binding protein